MHSLLGYSGVLSAISVNYFILEMKITIHVRLFGTGIFRGPKEALPTKPF